MENINKEVFIDVFTENITYLRKENNLSLKQMSEILNISTYCIRKIEKGILPHNLKVDILFKIEKHFGIFPQIFVSKKLNQIWLYKMMLPLKIEG